MFNLSNVLKMLFIAAALMPGEYNTNMDLANIDDYYFRRLQHLFTRFLSSFILLFSKSPGLHGPFLMQRSSMLEYTPAGTCHVKTLHIFAYLDQKVYCSIDLTFLISVSLPCIIPYCSTDLDLFGNLPSSVIWYIFRFLHITHSRRPRVQHVMKQVLLMLIPLNYKNSQSKFFHSLGSQFFSKKFQVLTDSFFGVTQHVYCTNMNWLIL